MKTDLYVELDGHQVECNHFSDKVKDIWKSEGNKVKDIKKIEIYYKPLEATCYYVINGNSKGSFMV